MRKMATGAAHGEKGRLWCWSCSVLAASLYFSSSVLQLHAQPFVDKEAFHSGAIAHEIAKLQTKVSVLYLAAHPDDENTRLISYLANTLKLEVSYLSLTRGSGGQNLIGKEQGPLLGLIRSEELRRARAVDGGAQYFTRAVDFGYSKTASESLAIWDEELVLADVVYAIRKLQPDLIITRFAEDTPGHGHHQASAILAKKAFHLAADDNAFPEQLQEVAPWQAHRLIHNLPHWLQDDEKKSSAAATIDVGAYYPLLGLTNAEIAAHSRTMHKSQGFGSVPQFGERIEYFTEVAGEPVVGSNIFSGLQLVWGQEPNAPLAELKLNALLHRLESTFDPAKPELSIPALIELRKQFSALSARAIVKRKLERIDALIVAAAGLKVFLDVDQARVSPGQPVSVSMRAISHAPIPVEVTSVELCGAVENLKLRLKQNTLLQRPLTTCTIHKSSPYSVATWLPRGGVSGGKGAYAVRSRQEGISAENAPSVLARVRVLLAGEPLEIEVPLAKRVLDPVQGELVEELKIVPQLSVSIVEPLLAGVPGTASAPVRVRVRAEAAVSNARLSLLSSAGIAVEPKSIKVGPLQAGEEVVQIFHVTVSKDAASWQRGDLTAVAEVAGKKFSEDLREISYLHIRPQLALIPAKVDFIIHDQIPTRRVAYILGSGDKIPEMLEALGMEITLLDEQSVGEATFERFDAIVLGIRALNTNAWLNAHKARLREFMEQGGLVVVQYATRNTFSELAVDLFPYPLEISRDRVTDEGAEVTWLAPTHRIFHHPFTLPKTVFDNWIQERGLYFASKWDASYQPILRMADPGESPLDGSLLVAPVGKGYFVYTGLSFFRQIPASVPGALQLFVNMLFLNDQHNE